MIAKDERLSENRGCSAAVRSPNLLIWRLVARPRTPSSTRSATWPTTCARRMTAVHQPKVSFREYDEMLADPLVDAVIIATADQFHVPAALKSARSRQACARGETAGERRSSRAENCAIERRRPTWSFRWGTTVDSIRGIAFARQFIDEEMGERIALKSLVL